MYITVNCELVIIEVDILCVRRRRRRRLVGWKDLRASRDVELKLLRNIGLKIHLDGGGVVVVGCPCTCR